MGCSECKFNKTCDNAFTTISQYCGNYNGDYEIVKLLLKMMNMEDEYKETKGFRGGKKPEMDIKTYRPYEDSITTAHISDVANLKIGEYQTPVTTTVNTNKYSNGFVGNLYDPWKVTCNHCPFNDKMVYTSYPPKYKCTITNEYHFGDETCNLDVPKMVNDLKKENEFLKTVEKEFVKYVPTEEMGKIIRKASKDVLGFDE